MEETQVVLRDLSAFDLPSIWTRLVITILIGLLIGIERERNRGEGYKVFAGVRTFPLIALLGFLSALLTEIMAVYVYFVLLLCFSSLVVSSYFQLSKKGELGATSSITDFLTFILGSLVFWNLTLLSIALAIVIVAFLSLKEKFREFVGKIDPEDIFATIKFAIVAIIILPILPDATYDPFEVLNPRQIWYFVVLVAGISFAGYVLFKFIGAQKGITVLSILGGVVSSTASTLSFAQKSKESNVLSRNFAAAIILASAIMLPRILLIIFVVNKPLAFELLIPFAFLFITSLTVAAFLWMSNSKIKNEEIKLDNPFKILFAIKFGLVFTAILFLSKASQVFFGDAGVYTTSFLAGLADVDAIALTMSSLTPASISLDLAAIAVLIAGFANTIVKLLISSFFGSKDLRKYTNIGFGIILISFVITAALKIIF